MDWVGLDWIGLVCEVESDVELSAIRRKGEGSASLLAIDSSSHRFGWIGRWMRDPEMRRCQRSRLQMSKSDGA